MTPVVVENWIELDDLPAEFVGTRICFVTDIHFGPWRSREWLRSIVDTCNSMHPDMVVLGGDYIEQDGKYVRPAFEELARLEAPLGKFAVMGNHDYFRGADTVPLAMETAGIELLDNRGFWIEKNNARLRLAGVGDLYFGEQLYGQALADATTTDAVILVSHQPDYVMRLPDGRSDLMLSGHLHGGQINFFGFWAPMTPSDYGMRFLSGLYDVSNTKLLVSNGVGTFKLPLRWFADPMIHLITLDDTTE